MEEILNELKLNINDFNKNAEGDYEYHLNDALEFGRFYARLDKTDLLDEDPDLSALTEGRSTVTFVGNNLQVLLQGDFDSDEYDLIIKEEE